MITLAIDASTYQGDVALLDEFARASGLRSRSAAVQHAIRLLRHPDLEGDYEAAWNDWESSGESANWEGTVQDGLADASR